MYILAPQNIKITLNFREENTVYSSDSHFLMLQSMSSKKTAITLAQQDTELGLTAIEQVRSSI